MPKQIQSKRRVRDPDATRAKLLEAAFEEIHRRGFQAASLETILARAGVTKGALYHHFRDKTALGYAVVDEVIQGLLLERWLSFLEQPGIEALEAIQRTLRARADSVDEEEIELGCPLNNLAQEMSPLDEGFRQRFEQVFDAWRDGFERALVRARDDGSIRADVDPVRVTALLVAAAEGSYGVAKSAQSRAMLESNFRTLADYLDTLRPAATAGAARAADA